MMRQFHERLSHALETAEHLEGDSGERVDALHAFIREQGVRGVHSTRYTLRRWLLGKGNPPPYWQELAAEFLQVNPRWLLTGDGVVRTGEEGEAVREIEVAKQETPPEPQNGGQGSEGEEGGGEGEGEGSEGSEGDSSEGEEEGEDEGEVEVSIPTAEDVWETNARQIMNTVGKVNSIPFLEAIVKHEPKHPNYAGGRKTVMDAATSRLEALRGEED